jgi:GGDEF domain-containing protein
MPDPSKEHPAELTCYLNAIVAIANCVGGICPGVGSLYRDRLLRLPRRLAFDANEAALEQSQKALAEDLTEYSKIVTEWLEEGAKRAAKILAEVGVGADRIGQGGDLHVAMLEDLAGHMEVSAQVDDEAAVRASLVRYAAGLRSYARKRKLEELSALGEIRKQARELEAWLTEADRSQVVDPETGLLNRSRALKQLQVHLGAGKPFCVLLVEWSGEDATAGVDQVIHQIGERLVSLVRPRDIVYAWGRALFAVIFECRAEEAEGRAQSIAGWLSGGYSAVVNEKTLKVTAQVRVHVVEPSGDSLDAFVQRIDRVAKASAVEVIAR